MYLEQRSLFLREKKFIRINLKCLTDSVSRKLLSYLSHYLTQKVKK